MSVFIKDSYSFGGLLSKVGPSNFLCGQMQAFNCCKHPVPSHPLTCTSTARELCVCKYHSKAEPEVTPGVQALGLSWCSLLTVLWKPRNLQMENCCHEEELNTCQDNRQVFQGSLLYNRTETFTGEEEATEGETGFDTARKASVYKYCS